MISAQVGIAILVGLAATIDDLRRRRIANWIPVTALAGGLGWQITQQGWRGGLYGLEGAAVGFGVFLIFYLLGGMGGGDIKLMTGFGALLGVSKVMWAALLTAAIGGILALGVIGVRFLLKAARKTPKENKTASNGDESQSMPYAPAITLGVWLSLVPKG